LRTNFKLRIYAIAILFLIAIALDLRREPSSQWSTAAAVGSIHLYQATLSPVYERLGVRCRFTLTCSHYGEEVVQRFGVMRGGWMAAKRVLRCGPWTPAGTNDPPPSA
jgi:putative membrane protein insertion efficiency factor